MAAATSKDVGPPLGDGGAAADAEVAEPEAASLRASMSIAALRSDAPDAVLPVRAGGSPNRMSGCCCCCCCCGPRLLPFSRFARFDGVGCGDLRAGDQDLMT